MTDPAATSAPETWEQKVARLRARKGANTKTCTFPDADLEEAAGQAVAAHRVAVRRASTAATADETIDGPQAVQEYVDEQTTAEREAMEEALARAADAAISFTFRNLPPDIYDDFHADYPPTDEQIKEGLDRNPVTLTPALIAACSVDGITAEALVALQEDGVLNLGDVATMLAACRQVNESPRLRVEGGLGKDFMRTPA